MKNTVEKSFTGGYSWSVTVFVYDDIKGNFHHLWNSMGSMWDSEIVFGPNTNVNVGIRSVY